MKENQWYCTKCHEEMEDVVLSSYVFEEGIPLQNVDAAQCPSCKKVSFTEEQADLMEERTEKIKKDSFGFERKITISGKSLVVTIPSELAKHLHIKKGQKVKIFPVAKDGILIRKMPS